MGLFLFLLFGLDTRRAIHAATAWRTAAVLALAQPASEDRRLPGGLPDPARLAVLADALEEAGATDEELLGHLRGLGQHDRGCFAVDAARG